MAAKKDNRRMVDMLERMGMIKREEDAEPVDQEEAVTPVAPAEEKPPVVSAVPEPETTPEPAPVFSAPEKEKYAYTTPSVSPLSSLSDTFWDDAPAEPEAVERYLEIDELYHLFQMKVGGIDTVYLLEEYIKTLPDSLPADLRRSIIVRIVQASGFDFDKLLSDGIDRVSKLNDYAADFATRTDVIVTQQNETISELERQIELVRAVISERKNLHKKQFLSIESEAQRLKKILDFITK